MRISVFAQHLQDKINTEHDETDASPTEEALRELVISEKNSEASTLIDCGLVDMIEYLLGKGYQEMFLRNLGRP